MPRQPANPHPLFIVRRELGWTQKKLADKCGVSTAYVKKIEGRKLPITRAIMGRLMWVTGVDPGSLNGKRPTFLGRPYTAELGMAHVSGCTTRKGGEFQAPEMIVESTEELFSILSDVLIATCRKNAYFPARWSLVEWLAATVVEFGLEKEFTPSSKGSSVTEGMLRDALKARKKAQKATR